MKVAVTGAHGKVGQFVLKELLVHGYEVIALTHTHWEDCPVEQISLDIVNYKEVYEGLKGCDGVIHLAAIPSPRKDADTLVLKTNVTGTYNILLASGSLGIKNVAIASSDCALGFTYSLNRPLPHYLPVDEEHPRCPDDCYGLSKVISERIADAMAQRFTFMSIASLRITYVADPNEYTGESHFMSWLEQPDKGPWNLWSYIDARDAARAFRLAIETDLHGHEVFHIAASNTRSAIPTAELIRRYFPNVPCNRDFNGYESLECSQKAEKLLGFKAVYRWNEAKGKESR